MVAEKMGSGGNSTGLLSDRKDVGYVAWYIRESFLMAQDNGWVMA